MTLLNMEYKSDILVRVVPLATGSAVDVHGQVLLHSDSIFRLQFTCGTRN